MLNVSICIPLFSKRTRFRRKGRWGGGGYPSLCSWQSPLKRQSCWGLSQQDGHNLFLTLLWQRMQITRLSPGEMESGRQEKCRKRDCKKKRGGRWVGPASGKAKWRKKNYSSFLWSVLMTSLSPALPSKYYINNCWRRIKQVKQWDGPGGCLPPPN